MASDYFFSSKKDQPFIYAYFDHPPPKPAKPRIPPAIELMLPPIVTEDVSFGLFSIAAPEDNTCKLTVDQSIWPVTEDSEPEPTLSTDDEAATDQGIEPDREDVLGSHTIRPTISNDYQGFLNLLEDKNNAALPPNVINLIKMRLAQVVPMTFAEILYYHYGYLVGAEPGTDNSVAGHVDLQAGMRLRIDYESYQLLHPSLNTQLNGFTGSGTSYYQVCNHRYQDNEGNLHHTLGFDPFLTGIQSTVEDGDGSGGIIDLLQSGYRKPYFRLLYPASIASNKSGGWVGTEKNVTLVGSNTRENITNATTNYATSGNIGSENEDTVAFHFRGRATIIPEICIFVNDQPTYVAVGTTVRQLLDRYLSPPPLLGGQNLSEFSAFLRLYRLVHQGPNNVPGYHAVHFEYYQAYDDGTDIFDLPIVKGDKLYID